ncbi:MAG: class I SAM-dependent methyltransferase [Candidatus Izemoplasmatales bacterium]|nr:class I SAM-dependent methyltransferase [Candidatus Izemoplasmatales bacterium]
MNVCTICQYPTTSFQHSTSGVLFHLCPHCEYIRKDELFFPTKEAELKRYNQHQNSKEDVTYQAYFARFIEEALIPFTTGKKEIDIGSGPQAVLAYVLTNRYGFEVDIHDPFYSKEDDVLHQLYDVVVCTEVIEHVFDVPSIFKQFVSLLHPKGVLAIMTSFHPLDQTLFQNWHYHRDNTHVGFFRDRTFEILSIQYGFDILYSNHRNMITLRKR